MHTRELLPLAVALMRSVHPSESTPRVLWSHECDHAAITLGPPPCPLSTKSRIDAPGLCVQEWPLRGHAAARLSLDCQKRAALTHEGKNPYRQRGSPSAHGPRSRRSCLPHPLPSRPPCSLYLDQRSRSGDAERRISLPRWAWLSRSEYPCKSGPNRS